MRGAGMRCLFQQPGFRRRRVAMSRLSRKRLEGGDADGVEKDGDDVHDAGLLCEPQLDRAFPHPSNEYSFALE